MVTLFVAIRIGKPMEADLLRTLVLGAPIVPMLLMVWAIARHFRRMDEFLRLRALENLSLAAAITAVCTFSYGFLETAGYPDDQHVLGVGDHGHRLGSDHRAALRVLAMKNTVRDLRTDHGWSQGDLADKLEVSRQTINAIETGRYDPSLPLAFAIAKLFGKPIEKIFTPEK